MKKLIFSLTVAVLAGMQAQAVVVSGYPRTITHTITGTQTIIGTRILPKDALQRLALPKTSNDTVNEASKNLHSEVSLLVSPNYKTLKTAAHSDYASIFEAIENALTTVKADKDEATMKKILPFFLKLRNIVEKKKSEVAKLVPLTPAMALHPASKGKMAELSIPMAALQKTSDALKDVTTIIGTRIGVVIGGTGLTGLPDEVKTQMLSEPEGRRYPHTHRKYPL